MTNPEPGPARRTRSRRPRRRRGRATPGDADRAGRRRPSRPARQRPAPGRRSRADRVAGPALPGQPLGGQHRHRHRARAGAGDAGRRGADHRVRPGRCWPPTATSPPARPTRSTPAGRWSARRTRTCSRARSSTRRRLRLSPARWQRLAPISETLTYAAPLVFTGLSVALAFRGGLFNIGAQGQATIGVILAAVAGFVLPLPPGLHLLVAVLAGALGGAIWGFIPGILKARTGAHEVINTIMLNYVALYFLTWLIVQNGVQDPNRTDAISKPVDSSAPAAPAARRQPAGARRHPARGAGHLGRRLAAQPLDARLRAARGRRQPGRRPDRRHQRHQDVRPGHGDRRHAWPASAARTWCSAPPRAR